MYIFGLITQLWTLFTAVALHKSIMAFTSGLRFAVTLPSRRWAIFYMFVFASTAPIGIGIGTVVSETGSGGLTTDIASAVLQGLATGTFIYVTFFEVLNEQLGHESQQDEVKPSASGMIKVLAAIIGYSFITVLELLTDG
jgi:solute carrier family 39 (zinc transporter), member 1/2/3